MAISNNFSSISVTYNILSVFYSLTPKQISQLAAYNGLYIARSVYQQMISARNIDLRLFYRQYIMTTRNFFYNHIFADETKIVTGHNGTHEWYRLNSRNKKHPRVAHRSGFSVFGGISRRGPTPFLIIPGNVRIDSEMYCNIIGHSIYPFMRDVYNMGCTLIQDNASIHVSKYTKDFLDHLGIRRSFFPPQSPDFTGIEYVWRNGKKFTSQKNPANLDELKLCIAEYVRTELTVEMCNTLIDRSIANIIRSVDGMNHEGVKPTDLLYRDAH